jgi:hypothetical protein
MVDNHRQQFEIIFKLLLFSKKKGEATLGFQNKNEFQNPFDLKSFKEKCFDLENKSFQKIFFETCMDFNCFSRVLQLTLPHHSKQILKLHDLKGFGKAQNLQNVFIKMISNSVYSLFQNVFFQNARFEKYINLD